MEIPVSVIASSVVRGAILLSDFEGIDHRKFFVVMGVSKDKVCGFFFINSNIHPLIFNKQELLDLQYPLKHSDYTFLKYDSFLCASTVIERSLNEISEDISRGGTSIIGRLKDEHIVDILQMVNNSVAISNRHKKLYFQ